MRTPFVAAVLTLNSLAFVAHGQITPIEFSEFASPKRVGIDAFILGQDNLIVGFDVLPGGQPLANGTIIDQAYESVGLRFFGALTTGPSLGQRTTTQSLNYFEAPNGGEHVAISPPNILSAVDPALGPGWSGFVAGTATIVVTFLAPSGQPGTVSMVGAVNDLIHSANTMTAFSGPDASGDILGTTMATGPGDFFGLSSPQGIGSVMFTGISTEIDNLVYSPIIPEPGVGGLVIGSILLLIRRCVRPLQGSPAKPDIVANKQLAKVEFKLPTVPLVIS